MKKILTTIIAVLIFWSQAFAQQKTYYIQHASLAFHGQLDGNALKLQTHELAIKLNYETAHISIRFPLSSLETSIDTLNKWINNSTTEVVFEGSLGMEYINTEDHAPIKFTTQGLLSAGDTQIQAIGSGELQHVGKNTAYACMLSMLMPFNLKDLNTQIALSGLEDNFNAVITQALLQEAKY